MPRIRRAKRYGLAASILLVLSVLSSLMFLAGAVWLR
jgi:hypothetical protein